MKNNKLCVAVVGMNFGSSFISLYLKHPSVYKVIMVDTNEEHLKATAEKYLVENYTTNYQDVLDDPEVDAIHLVVPPALHSPLSVKALKAGKHCACTIPMGMTMKELYDVIEARRESGKNFMFMETSVYTREFIYVKELLDAGELGNIQYMRCAHYQDMEGWPEYWKGYPPLMHPTHAVAPCLQLSGKRPTTVFGKGSGKVRKELEDRYGCPYAFESAFISLEGDETVIEMERYLYHVARAYTECFNVYADKKSFEWQQIEAEKPVVFTMKPSENPEWRGSWITEDRIEVPDYAHLLPPEIARYTRHGIYDETNPHLSFYQGGEHGGSHPHLIHEFVCSILENRPAHPNDIDGAYWTSVGLLAHESAMEGGTVKQVPCFDDLA